MKTGLKYFAIAIASFSFINIANAQSVLHEMNEREAQDTPLKITPKQPFDLEATQAAVVRGKSSITGVLYSRTTDTGADAPLLYAGAKPFPAANLRIYLYPMTPYMEEYHSLMKKYRFYKGKQKIDLVLDDRAYDYRFYTDTDKYGRFSFPNIKAGRYMIYAERELSGTYNQIVPVARSVSDYNIYYGQVGVTRYENRAANWVNKFYSEKIVDIKDNQNLEIDVRLLTNPDHPVLKNAK